MSRPPSSARIAASLVNGLRRRLIEGGVWPAIEADMLERAPELVPWLRDAERAEWVPLEGHLRLMELLLDRVGADGLVSLGHERLRDARAMGALAPLLRAWVREYGDDPIALMRVAPHAWHAVTRDAGRMTVLEARPGHIGFRVEGAPPELLAVRGWHALLSGFAVELLRVSGRQGSFLVVPSGGSLSIEGSWID